jgi:hypothetical protein
LERRAPAPWFAVGTRKLWALSILTCGVYVFYWFERQYRCQKRARLDATLPLVRTMFSAFYAPDLFGRVESEARGVGLQPSWTARSMAFVFATAQVASLVLETGSGLLDGMANSVLDVLSIAMVVGMAYPVCQVQATVNGLMDRAAEAAGGSNADRNERFTFWNWVVSAIGVVILASTIYLSLFPPDFGELMDRLPVD